MNEPSQWSLDQDPPRDAALARLLRAADGSPGDAVDWERLQQTVMRRAAGSVGTPPAGSPREWWDVLVQWRRVAAAASVAAILAAGTLEWRGESSLPELAVADAAPESVALARVVADYPDDDVLTSLLQTARNDELTSWGAQ
jgi:hypothetical protein